MPAIAIDSPVVWNPSAGEVIETRGGVVSSVTVMLAVPAAPLGYVAVAAMIVGPSAIGKMMLNEPFDTGAGSELTVTVAAGSSTVPVTVVGLKFRYARFVGDVIVTVGGRA